MGLERAASQEKVKVFLGRYPEYERRLFDWPLLTRNQFGPPTVKHGSGMTSIPIRPSRYD